ncbi:MAG: hypothetical protein VYE77_08080 [Planctomycetota bacterium]|nr:hypothetical protein [Planctomycetota bacterium]
MMIKRLFVTATVLAAILPSQQTAVDYPDSALVSPPELLFPFYTIFGGGTVRYQTMCPGTFAGLPTQPMMVTKVGMQIAGQSLYNTFEIRFGTTNLPSLTACFATNLTDNRLQCDRSNTVLQGGVQAGVPVNEWVEFELDAPFIYTPGEGLVLDLVSSCSSNNFCNTGTGSHDRLFSAPYTGVETCAALVPGSGLKFRTVFEPIGFPTYGNSCPGTGGFQPTISGGGTASPGNLAFVNLNNALGGAPTSLLFGFSRTNSATSTLPDPIGGGCSQLTSMNAMVPMPTTGIGAGQGSAIFALTVPNDPTFSGAALFAQWAQIDAASPAVLPVTASEGLIILIQ